MLTYICNQKRAYLQTVWKILSFHATLRRSRTSCRGTYSKSQLTKRLSCDTLTNLIKSNCASIYQRHTPVSNLNSSKKIYAKTRQFVQRIDCKSLIFKVKSDASLPSVPNQSYFLSVEKSSTHSVKSQDDNFSTH